MLAGKTGFTLTSFVGALMLPPTLTGVGFGAPGVGCVAGSRLALTVTVSDSLPTCSVMARSQSEAFVSSNSWRNALNPASDASSTYFTPAAAGNWNRPAASVVASAFAS